MDLLRRANACSFSVPIVPSKIKHSNAGLVVSAPCTLQKGESTGGYYETLVYYDGSTGEHTKKRV